MTLLDELFTEDEQKSLSPLLRDLAGFGRDLHESIEELIEREEPGRAAPQEAEDDQPHRVAAADPTERGATYRNAAYAVRIERLSSPDAPDRWEALLIEGSAGASLELDTSVPLLRVPVAVRLDGLPGELHLLDRDGRLQVLRRADD